jgi:hypothetical protein
VGLHVCSNDAEVCVKTELMWTELETAGTIEIAEKVLPCTVQEPKRQSFKQHVS